MSAEPLHVQHVVLSLEPGGLENGVVNVINGLDRERFVSSVVCLKHAGEFARRITDDRVKIDEMGWRGGNDPALVWRLARAFRRSGARIVHTRNAESFFYGFLGARLAGVEAIVHSEHGRTFKDRQIRHLVQRTLARRTDALFAVSAQLRDDLERHVGIPAARIEVLHNGVDLQRFGRAGDGATIRQGWGVGQGEVVVGTVGRLAAVKNQALLLRAAAASQLPLHVVLVGDGPEGPALRELARTLGLGARVHFLGHRDDVNLLLPAFDLFALPSLSEGMSNTLLEAMAAGVPPIVSDVGGNVEIVRDGIDGWIFASADVASLADSLRAACLDDALRALRARAARDRVRDAFDIRAMVQRYEALYRRVVHEGE